MLESRATAAIRASARPLRVAPVFSVIAWSAMIVPANAELVPKVAELATCQKTLEALAPPLKITLVPESFRPGD